MSRATVRTATAGPVIVALVAFLSVASGCHRVDSRPDPGPVSSPTVAPVGGPVAFHVRLAAGQRLTTRAPQRDNCPGLDALIELGSEGTIQLAAYTASCAAGDNARPGNGRHGVYRTSADIPPERRSGAVAVRTALGDATAFNQPYYECTNSCRNYTEPVAVITLEHPGDPAFASLTAYSEKGSIGLDRLTALLRDQLVV
jgi:hypothetical protein